MILRKLQPALRRVSLSAGPELRRAWPAAPTSRTSTSQSIPRPRRTVANQLGPAIRGFSTTTAARHGHAHKPKPGEEIYITFIDKEGLEHKIACAAGDNLLDIAQDNDLEMEGACGGSCACSTCHVIVQDKDYWDRIPAATDDEEDMLDLAMGLQDTSRLGCQVVVAKELDGMVVKLPSMTRNVQASDFEGKSSSGSNPDDAFAVT